MRVLLIGSGGREHALAWKMTQSERLEKLFVAPGNGGTQTIAENIALDVTDHAAVVDFSLRERIDLVVVGPEGPLVAGISDDLRAAGIAVFGPSKVAAQLEGSKAFTKALCDEMGIPTAAYAKFDALEPALAYLDQRGAPIVIKADGLAAGKGVTVAETLEQAREAVRDCFSGAFGAAGAEVVIEECLIGEEASLFAICDGEHTILMPAAQDHKRAFDEDKGPNTGGMGAYAPAPVMTDAMIERAYREIVAPAIKGMAARGTPFSGVLFTGLMITSEGPKLIEFNTRFGDPECQVLMMLLDSDVLDILEATAHGTLANVSPRWKRETALTVVLAANGYPGSYEKNTVIANADGLDGNTVRVFHAGTVRDDNTLLANGGRVLNVTAIGENVGEARERAYHAVDAIDWPDGFCRRDIGWRGL
ncbi:phosphoribosylamine--glycine ligase [Pelagibacterium halotolerans]|uniref:Phosphoribosylamine--glycine ligase n=1 Tax=Pelagibacterium halotolerans (strain DSM 22347 / JCM 15775 / CGMCC 1.7692 / B2) TaxID=1082931 RepID=G4RB11_PELHB|nr:phosphoribosylamine--glycine ligase [Pelagibacterium halotolerans]AEQ50520.1 phosphoribosylamine--glycine ligase [Pelagibacterium halotolerans B2]QJR19528.1 phosphoribosylamine--glycine ligase [Pelagibacterium halotolerans]SDZ88874.1 phosphoribosylamine--glycine ligase [Pelagibacterium halotolerans]